MIKIAIAEDSVSTQFQKTLESLKLDEFIRIAHTEDSLQISIYYNDDQIEVECIDLDFKESLSNEESIEASILKCCGYRRIKLTGMTVKDSNGVKIRPVIDIFVRASHSYEFPDILEFSKNLPPENSETLTNKVYFDSEILKSILESTSLSFKKDDDTFEIYLEKGQYLIKYKKHPPILCMDFLFNETVTESFLKHQEIAKSHGVFINFINNKPENLVFSKGLYKKIINNEKDLKDMMDFVEHAPKFQDSRDDAIDELKEFLIENYPTTKGHKYEYLEVFKQTVPKSKNKHSLRRFLGQ